MNGLARDSVIFEDVVRGVSARSGAVDVVVCPPTPLLFGFVERAMESNVGVGAQDCHASVSGAHTGDVSAQMIADAGARFVIVGHSERRADHGERSVEVRAKAEAALAAGLTPIVCVGETEAERDAGDAVRVVSEQTIASLPAAAEPGACALAYEPVWAIGTGRTPTIADIAEMHGALRRVVEERDGAAAGMALRLLYGGSVKPDNAADIFAAGDVDGALVGGASLKAESFLGVIDAAG